MQCNPLPDVQSLSHCGLTVEMIDHLIFLANKLVGFLILLENRVAHLSVLILQLCAGKVLQDAGPEGVAQDIRCGAQTVPGVMRRSKTLLYISGRK